MANYKSGSGRPTMSRNLSKREAWLLAVAVVVLLGVSLWQSAKLKTIQDELKRSHYAERLHTAQLILEGEMLRAAYFTAIDPHTKRLAKTYLEKFPK